MGCGQDHGQGEDASEEASLAQEQASRIGENMERIYTIPLGEIRRAPKTKRTAKAVRFVRAFIEKHMKSSAVKFDSALNEKLWEKGMRNIPSKIKVKAAKQEDGSVLLTLAE